MFERIIGVKSEWLFHESGSARCIIYRIVWMRRSALFSNEPFQNISHRRLGPEVQTAGHISSALSISTRSHLFGDRIQRRHSS